MPKSPRYADGTEGLEEFAEELRTSAADELEGGAMDTGAEQLLGVGRAIVFALQEVGARVELLTVALEHRADELAGVLEDLGVGGGS